MSQKYRLKCVYTGRRISSDGKTILQRFELLPSREPMHFKGIRGLHIGLTYECAKTKISANPTRVPDEIIDNPEWDAADALVDVHNAKKRAESAAAAARSSKPALKAAVEALKPLCKNLDYFERRALIGYLAEKTKAKK